MKIIQNNPWRFFNRITLILLRLLHKIIYLFECEKYLKHKKVLKNNSFIRDVGLCANSTQNRLIVRPVSAFRPSSLTDNFRGKGGYYFILDVRYKLIVYKLKLSVTEDGQTLFWLIVFEWNWLIIHPTSHHDELPLYWWNENNFL